MGFLSFLYTLSIDFGRHVWISTWTSLIENRYPCQQVNEKESHIPSDLIAFYRYDLLCEEGIGRSLRIFEGKDKPPVYRVVKPADGKLQQLIVKPEVSHP